MSQTGDMGQEGARVEHNSKLTDEIESLEAVDSQEDLNELEAQALQKNIESLKRERFSNSTDDERIKLIEEKLPFLKDWAEDDTAPVTEAMLYDPWGFVPEEGSMSDTLKKGIKRIKMENPELGLYQDDKRQ